MESHIQSLVHFLALHPYWVVLVTFVVAFGESLVIASFLFPGTVILLVCGALVPVGGLPALPICFGAVSGAVAGFGASYWMGHLLSDTANGLWPLAHNADLAPLGISFFQRRGGKAIFIGRFFGPLRATIPFAAGILKMPARRFWAANLGSAMVWAPGILLQGAIIGAILKQSGFDMGLLALAVIVLAAVCVAGSGMLLRSALSRQDRSATRRQSA